MASVLRSLQAGSRQLPLDSRTRQAALLAPVLLMALVYVSLAGRSYLAFYYSGKPDLSSLQTAARLDPGDAEIRHQLGRFSFLVKQEAASAVEAYDNAVRLNPHVAQYWLDLAAAYGFLGKADLQNQALQRAIEADPRTPDVAWSAATFFMVRGDNDAALRQFRVVMENDPYLPASALAYCWRIRPDADVLLRDIIPPSAAVHLAFLDLLVSKKETVAAAKVWAHTAQLGQPIDSLRIFDYIRYLVGQGDVEQAKLVWRQAAPLAGLSAYLPSAGNLVLNGDFGLDVLNGGFDWTYRRQADVALALDPTDFRSGHRSLSIVFDGQPVSDAGIQQLIPVKPNAEYEFSAYFKAKDIQGAGGPRFAIHDYYGQAEYFSSDELKDADFWKPVSGWFRTGPDARLVTLHVERFPAGSPIRGQLWVDDIRLLEQQP